MRSGAPAGASPVVFVSYSRDDDEWRRRFAEMLKPLARGHRLEIWCDDRVVVGYQWRPQLAEAIARSRAALLLVSPAFLASDFIMEQELPALMAHDIQLVPVLVRPCLWRAVRVLEGLQWAHDPERDGPVASSADQEGQIVRACLKLAEFVAADDAGPRSAQYVVRPAAAWAAPLSAGPRTGRLHDVPLPPRAFVVREELAGLRESVLGGRYGAVGVTGTALGLHGQGGIGKTVLAAALARDNTVRRHFPDGVFWTTVGERGDLVPAQIGLLERLGAPHPELRSASRGLALLRQALADRRCLLVIDDVWSAAAAAAFRATDPGGRVVYTTRDPAVLENVGADVVQIGVLPKDAARELLRGLTGVRVLPAEADRICQATGGVALAVALVGAAIGGDGRSWRQAADQLESGGRTFLDHPYANTFKAMQVGIAALGEDDALAYRSLAVYPEDTTVPAAAVARLWSHLSGVSARDTATRLDRLAARSLLTMGGSGISFHDLQREFLLLHTEDLSLGHADLLAAYRALLPPGSSWARLPLDEPYIWEHLLYHLRGSGEGAGISALACDLEYIAMRCFAAGPYAAESDLRQAADLFPGHAGIAWLLRLLTQWGHLFAQHPTIRDLAVTFASRTEDAPGSVEAKELTSRLPPCYLAPQWGLPAAQLSLARVLEGHTSGVPQVAFSPDGRRLASASYDGTVRLWDPATGQLAATLEDHDSAVNAVAFSPDGRLLASGSSDGTVRLRDLADGRLTAVLEGRANEIAGVTFSPDGRLLASTSEFGTVRLWDPATGQLTDTLENHAIGTRGAAFSPDGRWLACAGLDLVRLWDLATGQTAALVGHTHGVSRAAFSPDGRLLASASYDGTVRLWDPAVPRLIATLEGHTAAVSGVTFSPDGRLLASGSFDGTVRLWDPATGQPAAIFQSRAGWVEDVAFSPDGRLLASSDESGMVWLWDPSAGQLAATLEGHTDGIRGVACSSDGRWLASGSFDGTVRLWDPATGRLISTLEGDTDEVSEVAFSPDGRLLASAESGGTVRLWDPAAGRSDATFRTRSGWVNAVAFSLDGRLLASADGNGTIRLLDPATGQLTATLQDRAGHARALAFSPDGRLLASGGGDGTVRLWDLAAGRIASTLPRQAGLINYVTFRPDGRLLASAGSDGAVWLWDPTASQLIATLEGHADGTRGIAFSPDGRLLASVGSDRTVRLWDARKLVLISQLKVGISVDALAWGPRGVTVAVHQTLMQLAVVDRASHRLEDHESAT